MLQVVRKKTFVILHEERRTDGLYLYTERGLIRITPWSDSVIAVSYTKKDTFAAGYGIGITDRLDFRQWHFISTDANIFVLTKNLEVQISRETASVKYFTRKGKLLLAERERNSKCIEPFSAYRTVIDEHAVIRRVDTPDGKKNVIEYATREFDKELYRTRIYWKWQDEEVLYGLGQDETGSLNLRGTVRYLHQANLKIAMPVLMSSNGYGLFVPTGSPAIFSDVPTSDSFFMTEADEQLNYFFMYGPSCDHVIAHYRKLTGKAAMLPRWTFGFIQSQERYETQDEILRIAAEYRRRGVGLDTIVLDWHYWKDELWGQKSFDQNRFPSPEEMTTALHEENIHFMISLWPCMHEQSENYREMKKHGYLLPASDIYDAFLKPARECYWNQTQEGLQQYGVDAWWCDSCEPFTPEWTREEQPVPEKMYEEFLEQSQKMLPAELGNAYGLYHAMGIYEGQRGVTDQKRVVNLTRNGYCGCQKYGTILWSGDISASWNTMRDQIRNGLNFCVSGHPYWTFDIGGFFVKQGEEWFWSGNYDKGLDDPRYRELFVRWFQLGAFLPVFRSHGTDVRREMWCFGKPGEPYYDALLAANRLRYRLLPYIYSCAGSVWADDSTMMRLLAFDFKNDRETLTIDDQYMFGNAFMVCPVTEPCANAELTRCDGVTKDVYLPDGCDWYDYWTEKKYQGGQRISVFCELDKIPLFVRAGSIVPMAARDLQYADEIRQTGIRLHIYPGADGSYELYEDSGEGYDYEKGAYSRRIFHWDDTTQKLIQEDCGQREWMSEIVQICVHG